jgi:hypothetical protein
MTCLRQSSGHKEVGGGARQAAATCGCGRGRPVSLLSPRAALAWVACTTLAHSATAIVPGAGLAWGARGAVTGPAAVPWTPRGVAHAWRVAAPQVDDVAGARNPFAWADAEADAEEESEFDVSPNSHESGDAEAAEHVPVPASKLTLAEDAIGLSVFSVVYSVMLANEAAQRFARGLVYMMASLACSPVRLLRTAAFAVAGRCRGAASAAARDTASELDLLSREHRDRLLKRDGILHEAPRAPREQAHSDSFSTPLSSSWRVSDAARSPLDALQRSDAAECASSLSCSLTQQSCAGATTSSVSRASRSSRQYDSAASTQSILSDQALRCAGEF